MRRLIRALLGLTVLAAMLAVTAGTALAGGWAEAIIPAGEDPPTAGEERELRVTLLQHGVTPVDFGEVTISASLPGSSERLSVPATSAGNGEWIATLTFPASGDWQVRVTHNDLETSDATSLYVAPGGVAGVLPGAASVTAMLLVAASLIGAAWLIAGRRQPPIRPRSVEPAGPEPIRAG